MGEVAQISFFIPITFLHNINALIKIHFKPLLILLWKVYKPKFSPTFYNFIFNVHDVQRSARVM